MKGFYLIKQHFFNISDDLHGYKTVGFMEITDENKSLVDELLAIKPKCKSQDCLSSCREYRCELIDCLEFVRNSKGELKLTG